MTCPRHRHCAYTGTELGTCPTCHASVAKCAGQHGARPVDGWGEHTRRGVRVLVATGDTATLRAGQHYDPRKQSASSTPVPQPTRDPFTNTTDRQESTAA